VDLDNWIEKVKRCQYLQEDELKALCEYVSLWQANCSLLYAAHALTQQSTGLQTKEILVEESNVQPVNSPVTVSQQKHSLIAAFHQLPGT